MVAVGELLGDAGRDDEDAGPAVLQVRQVALVLEEGDVVGAGVVDRPGGPDRAVGRAVDGAADEGGEFLRGVGHGMDPFLP